MCAAAAGMQQVNVRLGTELKREAEDVLSLMGSTATEVIRALYTKIARGAKDYAEVMEVLEPHGNVVSEADTGDLLLQEGWSIAEDFYRLAGVDVSAMPQDDRPWAEVYADAMDEHFREKGLLS